MPMFPKIDGPCPYQARLAEIIEGEHCRLCKRDVFDLSAMTDDGRRAFLASCSGEICVSYRLPMRSALAAVAIAASVTGLPAAAADTPLPVDTRGEAIVIVGGAILDPRNATMVEHAEDEATPELPVIVEQRPLPVQKP